MIILGRWSELYENFKNHSKVAQNSERNSEGITPGRWDIMDGV